MRNGYPEVRYTSDNLTVWGEVVSFHTFSGFKGVTMKGHTKYIIAIGAIIVTVVAVFLVVNWKIFLTGEEEPLEKKPVVRKSIIEKVPIIPELKEKEPDVTVVYRKKISLPETELQVKPEKPVVAGKIEKKKKPKKKIQKMPKSYYARLNDEVRILFDYLDGRDYVKVCKIEGGTQRYFLYLLGKLSLTLPVISEETRDIVILMHNMAHFYRVMGQEGIFLGKGFLTQEREIIEPSMELLYEWITEGIKRSNKDIEISTNDLYEYACFFLNTLSGKAYLARRDSRTRILVLYYSLLVMDEANREDLNHHGIDILPPLNLLIDDIENRRGLEYRDKYLGRLRYMKKRVISHREKGTLKY